MTPSDQPQMVEAKVDVLVVDDEPEVASSTADVLRSEGLEVLTAGNLDEARRVLAGRGVRSVILDQQITGAEIPGAGGESLLGEGLDLPPVIVVSGIGKDSLEELHRAHSDRLFACLAKPVSPFRLIEVVKAAVSGRSHA